MGLQPQPVETHGRTDTSDTQKRAAAINVADRVAADYPHLLDTDDPANAGRSIAYDRRARADLIDLLNQLGLSPDDIRRTA